MAYVYCANKDLYKNSDGDLVPIVPEEYGTLAGLTGTALSDFNAGMQVMIDIIQARIDAGTLTVTDGTGDTPCRMYTFTDTPEETFFTDIVDNNELCEAAYNTMEADPNFCKVLKYWADRT